MDVALPRRVGSDETGRESQHVRLVGEQGAFKSGEKEGKEQRTRAHRIGRAANRTPKPWRKLRPTFSGGSGFLRWRKSDDHRDETEHDAPHATPVTTNEYIASSPPAGPAATAATCSATRRTVLSLPVAANMRPPSTTSALTVAWQFASTVPSIVVARHQARRAGSGSTKRFHSKANAADPPRDVRVATGANGEIVGKRSSRSFQIPGHPGDNEEPRHVDRGELMVLLQQELEQQEHNSLFQPDQGRDEKSRADEDILTVEPVSSKWILNPIPDSWACSIAR